MYPESSYELVSFSSDCLSKIREGVLKDREADLHEASLTLMGSYFVDPRRIAISVVGVPYKRRDSPVQNCPSGLGATSAKCFFCHGDVELEFAHR